jgi:hypothetical protein
MLFRIVPLAVFVGLFFLLPGEHEAAQKKKKKQNPAQQAANQQRNLAEVTALRKANLLLTMANGNYDGHRAKAMGHLNEAIKLLDARIEEKGAPAQEMENLRQEAIAAYYKSLRQSAPRVVEPQMLSNAQLYQAGQLLTQLRTVLVQNNQAKLLELVDRSLGEIRIALTVATTK